MLFNQFHDILAGCSSEIAYDDVYAFEGGAISHGLKLKNAASQKISWAIDTAHGIPTLSKYKNSTLEQLFTLYPCSNRIYSFCRLILNENRVQVKLLFDSGCRDAKFIREAPGGIVDCETYGREEPMQRFMIAEKDGFGIAVLNDSKYSSSIKDGTLAFIAGRSCYYSAADPIEDKRMSHLDIGEQRFKYVIMPYSDNLSDVYRAAEELNTEFPLIPETYHFGTLPECGSGIKLKNDNITVSALKPAEDGRGYIVRITEISGKEADVEADILSTEIRTHIKPFDILSFRLYGGSAVRVDFTENEK